MGEGLARAITIGSIVLTVASLGLAVVFARKRSRVRFGFDLARAAVGIGAILVMAAVTKTTTSTGAVVAAIAVGFALGFGQGSALEIERGERGLYARRSPVGIVLWCGGIVTMQVAGMASRSGTVRLGQTLAWFGACLGIGLMVGRTSPIRRTLAGAGVTAIVAALMLPTVALIAGTMTTAAAQSIQLTDEEVCALTPANRQVEPGLPVGGYNEFSFSRTYFPSSPVPAETVVETAIAGCKSQGWFDYVGHAVNFFVYLFASDEEALTRWQTEATMGNEWFNGWRQDSSGITDDSYDPSVDYNAAGLNEFGVAGAYWSVMGVEDRVVIHVGPFMLYGLVDNLGFDLGEKNADGIREPITLIEELITPMVETVRNAEVLLAGSPPPEDIPPPDVIAPGNDATVPPVDVGDTPPAAGEEPGADEPIEPEDAAAQAIAGLIAAASIGAITWAEATAEIGRILDGTGGADVETAQGITGHDEQHEAFPPEETSSPPESASTVQPEDPCGFQQDRYEGALGDWQRIQNQVDALRNQYEALTLRWEVERAVSFSGAVFDLGKLGLDIIRLKPPTPGMFRSMIDAAKKKFGQSIAKQLTQAAASGQRPDPSAIMAKAIQEAIGLEAAADGNPTRGAFGAFVRDSITTVLAANSSYDYLKFMDTLVAPGAIADPAVIRLIEKSSVESFSERIGPWVGVVSKYVEFWHKNKEWREGVEGRIKLLEERTRIGTEIAEVEYDLDEALRARDSWMRHLSRCRQEMG